ncbi:ABC transporter substrate-binding protein [Fulvivirga ulvae]|uniref:ABC transporter substrate-binding protein n=1 Tax=Fulvivirga ulvae TaxID=2904245 RepID=UPI001F2B6941|nr:ABC transporter substrate-binding protein [Fulvivirga ulvae]UII34000.1 ABC transporter substrate-binding protein [Fulvivirga ulvae]
MTLPDIRIVQNLLIILCFGTLLKCTPAQTEAPVQKQALDLSHASRFGADYLKSGATEVKINAPWSNSDSTVVKTFNIDSGFTARAIVCLSITHINMLSELGLQDRIVGIPSYEDVFDDSLRNYFINKGVNEVGKGGDLNYELLINLQPDLIIESAVGNSMDVNQKLEALGLRVILFSAHTENHPLGRLEWIKYLSLFTKTENVAFTLFNQQADNYEKIKSQFNKRDSAPKFFVGYMWKDNWYVAGGNSYMAQFIKDAGGQYILKEDTNPGNIKLSHETVIELLQQCDIWLHPGSQMNTISQLAELNLPPEYLGGRLRIYNNNRRLSQYGKNDFWQSGFVHPEKVLEDLRHIVMKNDSLNYYVQIK